MMYLAAGGAVFLVVVVGFLLYRRKQKHAALQRIQKLSREIEYAMEERGAKNPELLNNKLTAAQKKWEQGDYKESERIIEDVFRLVQLS